MKFFQSQARAKLGLKRRVSLAAGLTLVETLISMTLLSLLLGLLFAIYRTGARGWMSADADAELLGRVHGLALKVARKVEGSNRQSLVMVEPGMPLPSHLQMTLPSHLKGFSVISAFDDDGRFVYEPGRQLPNWNRGQVFYHDANTEQVFEKEVGLVGASREERVRNYILQFERGAPPLPYQIPLPNHFSGGTPIANGIKDISFENVVRPFVRSDGSAENMDLNQLKLTIEVEKDRYGDSSPARIVSEHFILFRN